MSDYIKRIRVKNKDGTTTDKQIDYNALANLPDLSNLSCGGTATGGHWETVIDKVWNKNDYIHIVSYDAESHIFTCNSGELDWATIGERLTDCVYPVCDTNNCKTTELPFNHFRELNSYGFVRLSDTEFAFKDTDGNILAAPNEPTMVTSKFHFEHFTPQNITGLNCKKARYTVTDLIVRINGYNSTPKFDLTSPVVTAHNCTFTNGWAHRSITQTECEIIGGYAVESSKIIQQTTGTAAYTESTIRERTRQSGKEQNNQVIDSLVMNMGWNDGVQVPRNGGLFKLERWVE